MAPKKSSQKKSSRSQKNLQINPQNIPPFNPQEHLFSSPTTQVYRPTFDPSPPFNPSAPRETSHLSGPVQLVGDTFQFFPPRSFWGNDAKTSSYMVNFIRNKINNTKTEHFTIKNLLLISSNYFLNVWRACIDRIPSSVALSKRGISLISTECPLCRNGIEETDHILVNCSFAGDVFRWLLSWCGIPDMPIGTVTEALDFAAKWGNCPKKRKIFLALLYGSFWIIWKSRNDILFNKIPTTPTKATDIIMTLVFDWIKHRGRFCNCVWANWCCSPFSIM
ncbi:hypothetical protein LXL04_026561 [Taraxacum kok-saghyz]